MCHSGIIIQLLEKMVLSLPQRHQEIKKKIKKNGIEYNFKVCASDRNYNNFIQNNVNKNRIISKK